MSGKRTRSATRKPRLRRSSVTEILTLLKRVSTVNYDPEPSGAGMFECENCESFVTERYVRVFAPAHLDTVRVCPRCEDLIRDGNETRTARSTRQ